MGLQLWYSFIVDDEPLVQIGIRSMLNWESMGIEIAGTATNGRQAYDIILEKHPEIVIIRHQNADYGRHAADREMSVPRASASFFS